MDFVDCCSEDMKQKIDFRKGPLGTISYPDHYFDGISAWGVFEHLLSPRTYFCEVERILKPQGTFVMMVPNANSLWGRFAYKEDIPRHLHFFSTADIQKYANFSGLTVQEIEFTNQIYSEPATGRDGFRLRLLKAAGVPWKNINLPPKSLHLKILSKFGNLLGKVLIHPSLEERLGISGIMVVHFSKLNRENGSEKQGKL
jgi:SAM-dependent methyltransferase